LREILVKAEKHCSEGSDRQSQTKEVLGSERNILDSEFLRYAFPAPPSLKLVSTLTIRYCVQTDGVDEFEYRSFLHFRSHLSPRVRLWRIRPYRSPRCLPRSIIPSPLPFFATIITSYDLRMGSTQTISIKVSSQGVPTSEQAFSSILVSVFLSFNFGQISSSAQERLPRFDPDVEEYQSCGVEGVKSMK